MNNSNKTTRELAIEWWRGLTIQRQTFMAAQYNPEWEFEMVSSSSGTIERIYLSEHPQTEQPKPEVDEDKYVNKLEREIFRMQTQITRKDIEVDELKEENKFLREANERMKEALKDLLFHCSPATNSGESDLYVSISKARAALQANPNT